MSIPLDDHGVWASQPLYPQHLHHPQGWQCPKCQTVNAPTVATCGCTVTRRQVADMLAASRSEKLAEALDSAAEALREAAEEMRK